LHLLIAAVTLGLPWSYWLPSPRLVTAESTIVRHEVLYLPDLRPMDGPSSRVSNNSGSPKEKVLIHSSAAAVSLERGAYKGAQPIVSNPPHPDNVVQTILQPDLALAPKLPQPLPFPSMISIAPPAAPTANSAAAQTNGIQLPQNVNAILVRPPEKRATIDTPKLATPVPVSTNAQPQAAEARNAASPAPQPASSAKNGSEARNLLVINAVEVPTPKFSEVPPGELHGAFTVSPGVGSQHGAMTANTAAGHKSPLGTGDGASPETASVPGKASGSGGTGTGKGAQSGGGAGAHSSGNSPFPAIAIQGGSGSSGRRAAPASQTPVPPQTSYAITIVSNGASGGGFKDFGVFRDEPAYTVYLDMSDAGAPGANWTLQYALDSHRETSSAIQRARALLIPPYATAKPLPRFSAEAARKGRGRTMVVFGVISTHGALEALRVMQTPDADLNRPLLNALAKWTFRPAEVGGVAVPVRFLLGVPINWITEASTSGSETVNSYIAMGRSK